MTDRPTKIPCNGQRVVPWRKKVRFATKTTHRSADKAKTAGLFLGMALILLSIIKSYESTLAPSPLPRSNPLESIPGTSLMAEPFSSSPRPQASPLGPCRCPPLLPTAYSCLLHYRWEQVVKMNMLKFILQEGPCRWRNIILLAT